MASRSPDREARGQGLAGGSPDPAPTLILSAADVRTCLEPAAALACVEETLRGLADATVESGPRGFIAAGSGAFLALPGALRRAGVAGVKWVCTLGDNPGRGLPKVRGVIVLSDADTGHLRAVLDAKDITALRTAALAVLAAKYCGRRNPAIAAVVGFGAVGRAAVRLLSLAFALREIRVAGRDYAATAARTAEAAGCGAPVIAARSVREAVTGADIVITATGLTADEPLVDRGWVSPGTVVCGVGSYQEIDSALIERADLRIVDSWDGSAHRGQFAPLIREGRLGRADVAELSDIVAARTRGRSSDRDTIVASLLGRGVFDLAVAVNVLDVARRRGLGRSLPADTW